MDGASGSSVNGWFIAGIVALVVGIGCFVLLWWQRKRKQGGDLPPDLAKVWRSALASMPAAERDGPVVVVLGERLAGKSTLIRGALRGTERYESGPALTEAPSAADLAVVSPKERLRLPAHHACAGACLHGTSPTLRPRL